ncbi:MAG: phage tail tube protein [Planctomycetota bacterium]
MTNQRISGIAYLKVDGRLYETMGEFTINPGQPMREGVIGTSRVVGYDEKPQIPSFTGKIVLTRELSLVDVVNLVGVTVQIEGPNGTTHVLREAWFAGEGTYTTGNGEIAVKFEGASYEEIQAA